MLCSTFINGVFFFFILFLQEGPHSTIPEDEFFDAVETGLDKIEEDRQLRVRLKFQSQHVSLKVNDNNVDRNHKLTRFDLVVFMLIIDLFYGTVGYVDTEKIIVKINIFLFYL